MKHNLLFAAFLLFTLPAVANGVRVGKFNYLFNETDKTASVTYVATERPSYDTSGSSNTVDNVEIPETVTYSGTDYTVVAIGDYAFCESVSTEASHVVKAVSIPSTVTSIGNHAFRGCAWLKSFNGWENVEKIGNSAFDHCSALNGNLSFPNVTSVGSKAFYLCGKLTGVEFPALKTLGESAFYSCENLATASVPVLEKMGEKAFYNTKALKSFVVPATLLTIPGGAFLSSGLESVKIEDGDTPLSFTWHNPYGSGNDKRFAFMDIRTLRSIYIGRNLNYDATIVYFDFYDTETSKWVNVRIGSPFSNMYSADITLGEKMTEAHEYLLHNSSVNTSRFVIPASILAVGYNAFAFHDTPAEIHYGQANPQDIDPGAFTSEIYNNTELHVPKGTVSKFMACTGWKKFLKIVDDLDIGGDSGSTSGGEVSMVGLDAYVFMRPEEEREVSALLKNVKATSWESSDDNIVEVTRRGLAFAYDFGEAVLTAKDADKKVVGRIGVFVCPTLTVVYPSGCNVSCRSVYNTPVEVDLQPVKGWSINTVTHDGVDVTDRVDSKGHYTSEPITADSMLHLALEENNTSTGMDSVLGASPVKLYVNDLTLSITGADASEFVTVTNLSGNKIYEGTNKTIAFDAHGIYIVRVSDWTFKIVI